MSNDALLGLILGWALALLSGPVAEHIRRGYRRKELRAALRDELGAFRNLMASVVYMLRDQTGGVDHEVIDLVLSTSTTDALHRPSDETVLDLKARRQMTEEELRGQGRNRVRGGSSLSLKTNHLPLLDTAISELTLFPAPVRGRLLDIREKVDLWNQEVPRLLELHDRTYDSSVSGPNRDVIVQNLEVGYRKLAERGLLIADRIQELLREW